MTHKSYDLLNVGQYSLYILWEFFNTVLENVSQLTVPSIFWSLTLTMYSLCLGRLTSTF